MLMLNLYHKS